MKHVSLLAGIAALSILATSTFGAGEIPFEKAKGWEIERSGGKSGPTCLMSKSYKDKEDNNAENAVIFALVGDEAVMSLVYQHWTWDKDEKVVVPFALDRKVVRAKSVWTGDGQTLVTNFPATLVPDILAAKKLILKFEDSDADFELAGFPEAYESLRRCDAAPAAIAPSPAMPSEARIKTFYLGAMLEAAIKECDVATIGKQRTTFDSKLSSLRKEMGPVEPEIAKAVASRPEPRCPGDKDKAKFQQALEDFIDKSPDEFAAIVEKRAADEAAAKDAPKP